MTAVFRNLVRYGALALGSILMFIGKALEFPATCIAVVGVLLVEAAGELEDE